MEIEHLISYLCQVRGFLEGGERTLMTEPIEEVIECLREGKKCEQVCEGLERDMVYDAQGNYKHDWSEELIGAMHRLKRGLTKTKEIIINIEAKNEEELSRQLVKAGQLIREGCQHRGFPNFDVCGEKVQVIIRDKEGD